MDHRNTRSGRFIRVVFSAALSLTILSGVVLSGCGSSGGQPATSPSASSSPSASAKPSTSSPAASSPAASSAAPEAANKERLAKLYEAAKKEGKVLVYGQRSVQAEKILAETWAKAYPGIEYESVPSRGQEALEKISTEQRTKNYSADVLSIGSSGIWQGKKDDLLEKWAPPGLPTKDAAFALGPVEDDGYGVVDSVIAYGILINTSIIKPADEPKSWADLADPKYKGKIMLDNPIGISPGNAWFVVMNRILGKDYLEKLSKNEVLVSKQSTPEGVKALARGEAGIMIPLNVGNIVSLPQGSPVKWIHPSEGAILSWRGLSLVKNAPHPNAAKLFMEWYMTQEAQDALGRAGDAPNRVESPVAIPEMSMKGKKTVPSQTAADVEKNAEYNKEAERLFVR